MSFGVLWVRGVGIGCGGIWGGGGGGKYVMEVGSRGEMRRKVQG